MREIVLDTETTGLDPLTGDRLVEIGCIELLNRFPTGKTFHGYFNPERDMPQSALQIHGLTIDFLKDQPLFAHRAGELVEFLGDAQIVAHNAMFDLAYTLEPRTGLMICVPVTRSTIRGAPSTAHCSMPSSWLKSMSNSPARARLS